MGISVAFFPNISVKFWWHGQLVPAGNYEMRSAQTRDQNFSYLWVTAFRIERRPIMAENYEKHSEIDAIIQE